MLEYLQLIKHTADGIAAVGSSLDDRDFAAHVLNSLPSDYNAFATSIHVCATHVIPEELHGLLLSEELAMDHQS